MRLQSIKLIGQFKCITGTEENPFFYAFSPSDDNSYQPLVLVGLNGSGKSNLIELISDIFCFSERCFNKQYQYDKELSYKFELKYSLFKNNQIIDLTLTTMRRSNGIGKVDTNYHHFPMLALANFDQNIYHDIQKDIQNNTLEYLPSYVIAYTSGQNQGLSSIYAKNQFSFFSVLQTMNRYWNQHWRNYNILETNLEYGIDIEGEKELREGMTQFMKNIYEKNKSMFFEPSLKDDWGEPIFDAETPLDTQQPILPTTLFIDHYLHQIIFIFLCMAENSAFKRFLAEYIHIEDLISFELDFRLSSYKNNDLVKEEISRFIRMASSAEQFNKEKLTGILTFNLRQLRTRFGRGFAEHITFFYKLLFFHLLSAKKWSADERKSLKKSKYQKNIHTLSGGLSPMRVMNIKLRLQNDLGNTIYDRLSDGEHQLIQVISSLILFGSQQDSTQENVNSLFIFDEPESHFNPKWRSEFIAIISKFVDLSNNELMISTHSPFLVSSSKRERVLQFQKNALSQVEIVHPDSETYGTAFDVLLKRLFDLDSLVSKQPLDEIRKLSNIQDEDKLLEEIDKFGLSAEKSYLLNRLINRS